MRLTSIDLADAWCALAIAILCNCNSEAAYARLENTTFHHDLTREDEEHMAELKAEGWTYREIGDMYGMSWRTINTILRRRRR